MSRSTICCPAPSTPTASPPSSPRTAKQTGRDPAEIRAERERGIPAKRLGSPAEFGAACAFLCSAQAGYITGQSLLIDGGAFPGIL